MREPSSESFAKVNPLMPLEVRGLKFAVKSSRLIDGIDLTIEGDGITVIMGPNGAGKSLFLRLLNGLDHPDEGSVTWGGAGPDRNLRRRQSFLFQTPVLLRRTVAANLDFVLPRKNRARHRDALLKRVGLAAKADQPARALSGGEAQRLALARALATGPDVLLLDEPTASLDPGSTAMIERIVTEEARTGTRVIFVTHDASQARRLGGEVVFIDKGRVVERATSDSFFIGPKSQAGRDYLAGRLPQSTDCP